MGEFFHSNRAIPGSTLFTIVDRCEDGYILNRPETFATDWEHEEVLVYLESLGINEYTDQEWESKDNWYKIIHGNDHTGMGGDCEYIDETVPERVIWISFGENGPYDIDESLGDDEDENPLGNQIIDHVGGYDEYSKVYDKKLDLYTALANTAAKPYVERLKEAVNADGEVEVEYDRWDTDITLRWNKGTTKLILSFKASLTGYEKLPRVFLMAIKGPNDIGSKSLYDVDIDDLINVAKHIKAV